VVHGTQVVVDLRPLQEPERMPVTAGYLRRLLGAFGDRPLEGESFVAILRTLRPDPTLELEENGLALRGRRWLPPTGRLLRSAGLTIDPFLLRGAELGVGADDGAIYHTAGGAVPLGSRLPVVASVLDLAPWELPERYAQSRAARFGHRLRARVLRDASALIVTSRQTGESVRKRLHVDPQRITVVPLAPDEAFRPGAVDARLLARLRKRHEIPDRFLLMSGLYDARKDVGTLLDALAALRREDAPRGAAGAWPPVIVLAGAPGSGEDEDSALRRQVARRGVGDLVRLTPRLEPAELAALAGAARAFVYPALTEGTGSPAIDALAAGVPVVASKVGPLPEIVGGAGIIVEPRDPDRLGAALKTVWADAPIHDRLRAAAERRASGERRTWADVADETREVYESVAKRRPPGMSGGRLVG
jgi:glycosyltransferase involved in cell wall biosynthesis